MNHQRSKARSLAVQAVYQWQLAGHDFIEITHQFSQQQMAKKVDVDYFKKLLRGVMQQFSVLDEALTPHIDRSIMSIDPVERAILRIACYELVECKEVPYRVVINEAVEQAKRFGASQGHKYVNGVLDKLAKVLRPLESKGSR